MKLKELTLTFENCETITLAGKDIGRFICTDICKETYETYNYSDNYISYDKKAGTIFIEIFKSADKEKYPFDEPTLSKEKETVFNRLKARDITWIDFTLEDCHEGEDPNPCFYVAWGGKSDYVNKWQYNYESKPGNLYILITKRANKHKLFKYVNEKYINDPKHYDPEKDREIKGHILKEMNSEVPPDFKHWLNFLYPDYEKALDNQKGYEEVAEDMEKYTEYLIWLGENYPEYAKKEAEEDLIHAGILNKDGSVNKYFKTEN